MPVKQKTDYADAGFILPALKAWCLSALAALLLAAVILSRLDLGGGCVGYMSSALSFISAVFAGAAAGKVRKTGVLYTAAVSAAVIVIALLTVGFIVAGAELGSSGVISVVSFTFAGCLAGAVFFGDRGKTRRRGPRPQA